MKQIDTALNGLIPIPSVDELKAADQDKLLLMIDWLGRWTHEIDTELRLRGRASSKPAQPKIFGAGMSCTARDTAARALLDSVQRQPNGHWLVRVGHSGDFHWALDMLARTECAPEGTAPT